jgi:Fe-S-cluster containining protein
MAESAFENRVWQVVGQLVSVPIVTPAEYRQITCNRCGLCCEDIRSYDSPEAVARKIGDPELTEDRRRFLSGLEPVEPVGQAWRYRCRHFARNAEGLGCCTIHETRPEICRGFPYGKVVRAWRECAWFVEVRDEHGNIVHEVPPLGG